jgi:hypothetical protein
MTDLNRFGPAGSFDHGTPGQQVRNLFNLRHKPGAAEVDATAPQSFAATAEPGAAVAADAPVGNAAVPTAMAAPVEVPHPGAVDTDALRAAANQAANGALADPAFQAGARQVPEINIVPELIVQGQQGPIDVPVRIAVPASTPHFTISAPTVTVVDPATGQAIASSAAGAAPAEVAAEANQGFRAKVTPELIGQIFGKRGGDAAAGAVAAPAAAAPAEAGAGAGLLAKLRQAAEGLNGVVARGAADAAPAAPVAQAAEKAGDRLLSQLRALRVPGAATADVADAVGAVTASGLGDKAVEAFKLAMKARS